MNSRLFPVFLILVLFAACNDSPVIPEETQLVLQAYLHAGQPVNDVSVMMSVPFSNGDTTNVPVTDATVVLLRNGSRYTLTALANEAGRYAYAGSDLEIRAGDAFRIEVTRGGAMVWAETVVPGAPANFHASRDTVRFTVDTVITPMGPRVTVVLMDSLLIRWDNPQQLPHFLVVESIDPARSPISNDTLGGPGRAGARGGRFINEPTTQDFLRAMPQTFTYTGLHAMVLYRVNNEYFDLYKSRQQDSRVLNEPLTNVHNGLGIFTAFNSDSVLVHIVLQP